MKTDKFAVIKAKYSSPLYGGGRCKPGEIIVMFPRNTFDSVGANGKKAFSNTYGRLNDLQHYPEFAEVRQKIIDKHHIDPDTYGKMTVTWRH